MKKKTICIIVGIVIFICIIVSYKRSIIKKNNEILFLESVERALNHCNNYKETKEIYELNSVINELTICFHIYNNMEETLKVPSFSYEIAMTRDIIQNRMEKIKDIDFLIR